ncbi:PadR family transcriptional regulator [Actinomadura sp. 9N407]|uniref:PadR family transcriptional regulator n=1 Tax=Actinomadura sp. 9N407 TaxID=3375154 RepID=UPI00379234EA
MARTADSGKLPATAWAVLGILSFGEEMTGYAIRQWADHVLRFFYWSPAMSQIYSELKRLERLGYAVSRAAVADDGRGKQVYTITEPGRAALAEWAAHAPVEPPVLKHGPMLRAWLGHLSSPELLREQLEEHRSDAERTRAEAEYSQSVSAQVPGWAYPELVTRWATRYYTAQRDLADRMLADLDDLARREDGQGEPEPERIPNGS